MFERKVNCMYYISCSLEGVNTGNGYSSSAFSLASLPYLVLK